jgi:hypothetical protein
MVTAPLERVYAAFQGRGQTIETTERTSKHGTVYHRTNCPGTNHKNGDANPSLDFWEVLDDEGQATVAFHCWSGGCSRSDILAALKLDSKLVPGAPTQQNHRPILTLADLYQHTLLDHRLLFNLGWSDGSATFHRKDGSSYVQRGVVMPYYRADGTEQERAKIRLKIEKTDERKQPRWLWTEGDEEDGPVAYGLQHLERAQKAGYIVVVEGESDFATLFLYGVPALGIPGANNVKRALTPGLLDGIGKVYIIQEKTDAAGKNFPYLVKQQLLVGGYQGEVLRIPLKNLTGDKDTNDLHKRIYRSLQQANQPVPLPDLHSRFTEVFQKAVAGALAMEADTGRPGEKPPHICGVPEIDTALITKDIHALYDHAQKIVELPEQAQKRLRLDIRSIFGREFPMREFDDLLRAEWAKLEQQKVLPHVKSARKLMDVQFQAVDWIVPGILPQGLIALAGKQKIGKSWLDYNLALAVASGGMALGDKQVTQGDVLYLALEDNERRLQERIRQLLGPEEEVPESFEYATEWPRMDADGVAALEQWIKAHPNARLIIIDPWVKVKPRIKSRAGETGYDADYEALEGLKKLTDKYKLCILIQFHLRKAGAEDPMDELNGTSGITACADGFLSLKRGRGEADATLWGTGRDFAADVDLALAFNNGFWQVLGGAQEYALSKASKEVVDILKAAGSPMWPKDIAVLLEKPVGSVRKLLFDMKNRGEVKEQSDGYVCSVGNGGNGGNASNPVTGVPYQNGYQAQNITRFSDYSTSGTWVDEPVEPEEGEGVTSVTPVTAVTPVTRVTDIHTIIVSSKEREEYKSLFKEVREGVMHHPPKSGYFFWSVTDSDMPFGKIDSKEYLKRLLALGQGNDLAKFRAGKEELLRCKSIWA